ncbi:MAG: polysaccharide deacetylase family protein, partial [Thermoproteus sp.]
MLWNDIVSTLRENSPELFRVFVASEEYESIRDQHGRFLAKYTQRDPSACEVSMWLLKRGLLHVDWPDGAEFAVALTHDIDYVVPKWSHIWRALHISIRSGDLREATKRLFSRWIKRFNPIVNIRHITKVEEEFNAKSTFFVLVNRQDYMAGVKLELIAEDIAEAEDKGWEVGLHAGYFSYNDPRKIQTEKQKLERYVKHVVGIRNHFLRFDVPHSWLLLSRFFIYDSTYGYADAAGFRNGVCHPFKPATREGTIIDIWELPLSVMDTTLQTYMKLDINSAFFLVKRLTRQIKQVGGVLVLLWHNNRFDPLLSHDWHKLYISLLKYFRDEKAYLASAFEIIKLWEKQFS